MDGLLVGHDRLLGPHQLGSGVLAMRGLPCHAVRRMHRILQLRPTDHRAALLEQHIVPHRRDGLTEGSSRTVCQIARFHGESVPVEDLVHNALELRIFSAGAKHGLHSHLCLVGASACRHSGACLILQVHVPFLLLFLNVWF